MSLQQLQTELIDLFDIYESDTNASFSFSFVPNSDDVVFELNGSNYQFATTPIAFSVIERYAQQISR